MPKTSATAATGADKALDNLASVAINTSLLPGTSDGAALGSTTKQWSDLFLAEGGVINWDNGDATLTQVGDVVTVAGADLKVTSAGNVSTSVVNTDATQTLTNKTLSGNTIATMLNGSATVTVPALTGTLPIIIKNSGTASSTTNSGTEANLVAITLPTLDANASIVVEVLYKFVGTAGTKTPQFRHSTTSGDTSAGTALISGGGTVASATLEARYIVSIWNSNSVSAQIFMSTTPGASGLAAATTTPATGAINTGTTSYINLNCSTTNSGDTGQVVGYRVIVYPGV